MFYFLRFVMEKSVNISLIEKFYKYINNVIEKKIHEMQY